MNKSLDLIGIGNAIVDVLAQVDDAFLESESLAKGGMALIDAERAASLSQAVAAERELSGGSVANTMVGLADLGGRAAFIGKVGTDSLGETFRTELTKTGVDFLTPDAQSGPPTAQCVVLVTPDAQRTMNTYLGACVHVGPEDVDVAEVHDAFTIAELLYYEALGFCDKGDAAKLLDDGETSIGGRIPVNPSGGLLRKGHPVGATGLAQVHELVTQLRGEAGKRQVQNAKIGLAENGGGYIGKDAAAMVISILEH